MEKKPLTIDDLLRALSVTPTKHIPIDIDFKVDLLNHTFLKIASQDIIDGSKLTRGVMVDIIDAIDASSKLLAVKMVKEYSSLGLKDAKGVIDIYCLELKVAIDERQDD